MINVLLTNIYIYIYSSMHIVYKYNRQRIILILTVKKVMRSIIEKFLKNVNINT